MNSLPEQFSAARQAQLDNSFNLIRSLSDQALDRTSRVFALQLDASRTAVEQSSDAMRQLLAVRDPRDLLALGSQSQQNLRTMLDYGRELFSIATAGMTVPLLGTYSVDTPAFKAPAAIDTVPQETAPAQAAEAAAEAFERIGSDTASAAASAAEAATEAVTEQVAEVVSAPVQADAAVEVQAAPAAEFALPTETDAAHLSVVTSDVEPGSAQTAIAKAASEALDASFAQPHPVAASVPVEVAVEIEVPKIEPVDATPPPAAVTGRPAETRGTKGRRKQS
ncbi:phasin family protein [Massilia niabensis]|uniref:Phasin family protein n=1 Tax=Massilia niabensis TaxID=544910 RepID=A0ABW0L6N1_9BURK